MSGTRICNSASLEDLGTLGSGLMRFAILNQQPITSVRVAKESQIAGLTLFPFSYGCQMHKLRPHHSPPSLTYRRIAKSRPDPGFLSSYGDWADFFLTCSYQFDPDVIQFTESGSVTPFFNQRIGLCDHHSDGIKIELAKT